MNSEYKIISHSASKMCTLPQQSFAREGCKHLIGPEIGRDGKDSLDAYDPDGTRVEIMEFTPVHKPCCHPYTAGHPKP
jgi:hypothetical protein